MARAHFKHTCIDPDKLKVIQNCAVYLFAVDTGTLLNPPTGTAVTGSMYAARTGGAPIANPLISNSQGEVEAWFDTPQTVDVVVTDNGDAAHYPGGAGVQFPTFKEIGHAYHDPADVSGGGGGAHPDLTTHDTLGLATQAELDAVAAATAAHLIDPTDAHDADDISFVPAASIAATNVQAAIEEVAAEAGAGHTEDHDHDGAPTQKLLAANTHQSPAEDTHHPRGHNHSQSGDTTALVPESLEITGGPIALRGDISPTTLSGGDHNDYNPTGLADAAVLRLSSSGAAQITGLAGGADGRVLFVVNVGANTITLADESASSTAANRFAIGGNSPLAPDEGLVLVYDATASRWRIVGHAEDTAAGGGGGGWTGTIYFGPPFGVAGGAQWTNQPAAENFWNGASLMCWRGALNDSTEFRWAGNIWNAGFAGSELVLSYDVGGGWVDIDAELLTAHAFNTAWAALPAGAIADPVTIAIRGRGGNNTADPAVEHISVMFR